MEMFWVYFKLCICALGQNMAWKVLRHIFYLQCWQYLNMGIPWSAEIRAVYALTELLYSREVCCSVTFVKGTCRKVVDPKPSGFKTDVGALQVFWQPVALARFRGVSDNVCLQKRVIKIFTLSSNDVWKSPICTVGTECAAVSLHLSLQQLILVTLYNLMMLSY